MSDDGRAAIVVIAMLGSPFSPRYARARAAGPAEPLEFSALNVSIQAGATSRWALTERGARAVTRDRGTLAIGRSCMRWLGDGDTLDVAIDERSAPWGLPVRGRLRFHPTALTQETVPIDGRGAHLWWPLAPAGRVEVELEQPRIRFTGSGYLDSNAGDGPLEDAFARWSWARLSSARDVAITYDVETRADGRITHGYRVDGRGVHEHAAGTTIDLGASRFGLRRELRTTPGTTGRIVRTVEDGPFYARSIVEVGDGPRRVRGFHEVVSLERFTAPWVQFLIPFRMRREAA